MPVDSSGPQWYVSPRTPRPRILLAWHFARSFRRECVVGLPGIVLVAISIGLSAMTYWMFTSQVKGSHFPPMVGAADSFMSAFVFSMSRSSEHTHHTFDRQVSNLEGGCRPIHRGMSQLTLRVLSSATTRPPHKEAQARRTSDGRNYPSRHEIAHQVLTVH